MVAEEQYKRFLTEIGWEEFNNVEKQYLFDEINSYPANGEGILFTIHPSTNRDGFITIQHRDTGAILEIPEKFLKNFREWLENKYAQSEDGSSYYAFQDALEKEEIREHRYMIYESDIDNQVLTKLKQHFSLFSIAQEVPIHCAEYRYVADYVVYDKDDQIRLIVEAKHPRSINPIIFHKVFARLNPLCLNVTRILTDGEHALVAMPGRQKPELNKLDDVLNPQLLNIEESSKETEVVDQKILTAEVKAYLHDIIEHNREKEEKPEIRTHLEKLHEFVDSLQDKDIQLDDKDNTYVYLGKGAEISFFKQLLGTYGAEKRIIKFATSRSIDDILLHKTMNMCSIVCMNDPSEGSYADEFLFGKGEGKREEEDDITPYIISACPEDNVEDLTMWRLYGDDAKGVCLVFDVNNEKLNNSEFYLAPISYAEHDGSNYKLKLLQDFLKSKKDASWRFRIKNWAVWKHFFKKNIYSDEKEVRLLYLPQKDHILGEKKWFTDSKTSIHSEMMLFKMTDANAPFPLTLNRIILGVKFPNKDINAKQYSKHFRELLDIQISGDKENVVSVSSIEDYR